MKNVAISLHDYAGKTMLYLVPWLGGGGDILLSYVVCIVLYLYIQWQL